jgi:DNA-binding winged helix-turn-helix (wHTH) protein/tetratricopeptide (TPR) repeat protein
MMVWYAFGEYELDAGGFVLRRGDAELPLQPKVFDVLCYLIEQRGRIVTKAELLDKLWPNEFVNEAVVTWSISHIRRAFGQERAAKTPIETVHGRGYRFTATVTAQDAPSTPAKPISSTAAFVGRERVLAELGQLLSNALDGRGSLCALTGEAGIGKTRCSEELIKRATALGMRTLVGRSPEVTGTPPLWPLGSALRAAREVAAERASHAIAKLAESDKALGQAQAQAARFAAIEEVAQALCMLASGQPILLVLDDLHWADSTTLEWLAFIAPELSSTGLCIVVTLRDGETERGSPRERLMRQVLRHAQAIALGSLDGEQVAALMTALHAHRPSIELSEAVRQASGGVPLFVLEVLRALVRDHGQGELDGLQPAAVRVPELARDILSQRVAQLPPATIEVATQAAVIGASFDLSLLASALELEPEALLDRLAPAIAEGQIVSESPHTYRFAHALYQSVIHDGMRPRDRALAHRKVAELLTARPAGETPPSEIARHYYLSLPAGDHELVARITRQAGEDALRRFAFEEAALCFGWALEAQMFGGSPAAQDRADLLFYLASAQRSAGRTGDAMDTAAKAIELSLSYGLDATLVGATRMRRVTIGMALLPDPLTRSALEKTLSRLPEDAYEVRVSALAQLACVPPYEPDLSTSKRLSAQAVALAEQIGERELLFEALRSRLVSLSGPDDVADALEVANRMLALDRAGPHSWQSMDARVAKVSTHLLAGDIADADIALDEATAAVGSQYGEASFYCRRIRTQRLFLDGHFDEAEARWREAHKLALRAGVSYAEGMNRMLQLQFAFEREGPQAVIDKHVRPLCTATGISRAARAEIVRVAAGAGALELVRNHLPKLGDPSEHPRTGSYLHGLACASVGAIAIDDRALCERLFNALAPYEGLNTPDVMGFYLGSVSYFLGVLTSALGQAHVARTYLERALSHNRAMGYRAGVVRTLLASGRVARELAQHDEARAHFETALTEARAIGMRAAAAEATAGLR